MAVIEGGASAALVDVGANTKAMRVEDRPVDVGSLGAYHAAFTSGTMAAGLGAGALIFSARWGDATRTCIIRRISLFAQNAGTAFAAGLFTFDAIKVTGWTVSDSAGTALLPFAAANTAKKRANMGGTLFTDLRISATAAITAGGTKTLDSHPFAVIKGAVQATATNYIFVGEGAGSQPGMTAAAVAATATGGARPVDMHMPEIGNSWPIVLTQDTGFNIRATVPATGTWIFSVEMEWAEVTSTAGYN